MVHSLGSFPFHVSVICLCGDIDMFEFDLGLPDGRFCSYIATYYVILTVDGQYW